MKTAVHVQGSRLKLIAVTSVRQPTRKNTHTISQFVVTLEGLLSQERKKCIESFYRIIIITKSSVCCLLQRSHTHWRQFKQRIAQGRLATQQGLCWHHSNAPDMWAWNSAETLALSWSWLSPCPFSLQQSFSTPHCSAASTSLWEPCWELGLLNIAHSRIFVGPQQVDLLRFCFVLFFSIYRVFT